jgi:Flp pilus assembly protein CpaB
MRTVKGFILLAIAILLGIAASSVVFRRMNKPVAVPGPVVQSSPKVVLPEKPPGLSETIPVGMRAFSVPVNEVSGVSRKLERGDRVDVIATSSLPGNREGKVSQMILENVEVIAMTVDQDETGKNRGRQSQGWTVTLLVTPHQSTVLAAAAEAAKIRLLARNPEDGLVKPTENAYFTSYSGGVARSLCNDIPVNLRAVTISVRQTDGICGDLHPHDRVDVVVTCPYSRFSSGGDITLGAEGKVTESRMISKVLLQNVEILATEKILGMMPNSPEPVEKATLLVTPADAEKLAVVADATQKSVIRLIARNPGDDVPAATQGQYLSELLTGKREFWSVDVLRQAQTSQRVFYEAQ